MKKWNNHQNLGWLIIRDRKSEKTKINFLNDVRNGLIPLLYSERKDYFLKKEKNYYKLEIEWNEIGPKYLRIFKHFEEYLNIEIKVKLLPPQNQFGCIKHDIFDRESYVWPYDGNKQDAINLNNRYILNIYDQDKYRKIWNEIW